MEPEPLREAVFKPESPAINKLGVAILFFDDISPVSIPRNSAPFARRRA
jgi:hypothetical protein